MKMKKVLIIIIFFLSIILTNLLLLADTTTKQASTYRSNGDLIEGWNWLRDSALQHYAEWTFEEITPGEEDLILDITALATDRPDGGRGFEAKFKLIYGFPGSGNMGGVFKTKTVILPNISAPDDSLGYTCQGQVSIDRAFIPGATTILIRIERESPQDNHVAFRLDSMVMMVEEEEESGEEEEIKEQEEAEVEGEEEQIDTWGGASLIQAGDYSGYLGEEVSEGQIHSEDYYQIYVKKGQLISLQLTVPGNANYGLSLLNSNRNSRGSSITRGDTEILNYVADTTGNWYIKIYRTSGIGEYQLSIEIENQNDADSGKDAEDSYREAIPVSEGTITGLLKAGDNDDYFSIELTEGQLVTLELTIPGNASYSISLLNPNHNSRGSSITLRDTKILDYVADSTGTWYIKISRSTREGEYQLSINIEDQNDAGSGQDAGDSYEEAISLAPGTFTGLLKAGDNDDYYSINLVEGQQITLNLTIPGNASFSISLLNPNHNSRGSSITQLDTKTLDYVADSIGTWYIRVSRSYGEGEYQLSVNDFTDGSEEEENHPPVISSLTSSQNSVEVNQTANLNCNVSDQDGDPLTYNWTANGQLVGENTSSLNWVAPGTPGTYHIVCTVSDSKGGQDSDSISIIVTEPESGSDQTTTQVLYQIKITTGTKIGAGTDANVYITLVGQNGENSGEILLDNPGINDFEIGDTNIFWINTIAMENLHHIIIRHDNTGIFPGWYVEEVRIICQEMNKDWMFYTRQWLATDEPPEYRTQGTFYHQQEEVKEDSIKYTLSLTEGGRVLTSNLPILVSAQQKGNAEVDADGDGINQEWEDKAMEYINPYIELDEEEPWLDNQGNDYVAHYVRVHPYDPFSVSTSFDSDNLPPYIIFRYVVTWSEDYGRQTVGGVNLDFLTSHHGDHERIFMAWKVVDSNTLQLEWVFTSSHREPDVHHGVWKADSKICNLCEVSNITQSFEHTEVLCGNLDFSSEGILVFYASEGKHALYPSCELCDNTTLAHIPFFPDIGEDCCGGGRFRFNCYNVGEPPNFVDPSVHDLTLDNGKLGDTLPEQLNQKLQARYEVKITTGNVDRAGTDSRLDITLYGNQDSHSFSIYTNPEPPRNTTYLGTFEKGDTDYIYVSCSNLGEINQIRIVSDNSGEGPGWYVSKIEVKNLQNNNIRSINPNVWIQESEQLSRTFNLS